MSRANARSIHSHFSRIPAPMFVYVNVHLIAGYRLEINRTTITPLENDVLTCQLLLLLLLMNRLLM